MRRTILFLLVLVAFASVDVAQAAVKRLTIGGIEVLFVPKPGLDYVTVRVVLTRGALSDPKGKAGLALLTAKMLLRGTRQLTRAQISEQAEFLGSTLSVSATYDAIVISGDALGRNLDAFMKILSQVILEPTFTERELVRLKRLTKSRIEALREKDSALASSYFRRFLFGRSGQALGHPLMGTSRSIDAITRADVVAFHRRALLRKQVIIGFTGNIDRSGIAKLMKRYFGAVPRHKGPRPNVMTFAVGKLVGRRLLVIDKPGRTQTQIVLGHLGIDSRSRHFFPLTVANTVFGGTFTARLMQEIREKRGWSYGAYSSNAVRRDFGMYSVRFYPANKDTVPALKLALKLYETLIAKGITAKELDFAKSYITNSFKFKIDTPQKQLAEAIEQRLLGRPGNFLRGYLRQIQRVQRSAVQRTLSATLSDKNLIIVIVGTWKILKPRIAEIPGLTQVLVNRYDREWDPKDVTASIRSLSRKPRPTPR